MNMAAASPMMHGHGLPAGMKFEPTDQELINYYLKNRVSKGFDFPYSTVIPDCPEFVSQDPWTFWESHKREDCRDNVYFFTERKKVKTSDKTSDGRTNYHRQVGSGTWINNSWKHFPRSKGSKRVFRYKNPRNAAQNYAWLMTEYELSPDQDLVLCVLRPSPRNSTPLMKATESDHHQPMQPMMTMTTSATNDNENVDKKRKRESASTNSVPKRNPKASRKPKQAHVNSESTCDIVVEQEEHQVVLSAPINSETTCDVVVEEQEHQPRVELLTPNPDQENDLLDMICIDEFDFPEIEQLLLQSTIEGEEQDQLPAMEVMESYQDSIPELVVDIPNGVDDILAGLKWETNEDEPAPLLLDQPNQPSGNFEDDNNGFQQYFSSSDLFIDSFM